MSESKLNGVIVPRGICAPRNIIEPVREKKNDERKIYEYSTLDHLKDHQSQTDKWAKPTYLGEFHILNT